MAGFPDLITFDMGGTSSDVALLKGGVCHLASEAVVHGYPIKAPMLDIHTVGAGGGSIAYVDSGGLLKVGPRSAGAFPAGLLRQGKRGGGGDRRERRVADAEPHASAGRTHGGAAGLELARAAIARLADRLGMGSGWRRRRASSPS